MLLDLQDKLGVVAAVTWEVTGLFWRNSDREVHIEDDNFSSESRTDYIYPTATFYYSKQKYFFTHFIWQIRGKQRTELKNLNIKTLNQNTEKMFIIGYVVTNT